MESCERCGVIFSKVEAGRRLVTPTEIVVTTGDLKQDYRILGPVFFAVSNKGIFSSQLDKLAKKHGIGPGSAWDNSALPMGLFLGEWPVGQQQFPMAFMVAIEEIKRQVMRVGGDGIVWLRMDIDLDTTGFQFFYMQVYGTAVLRRT
jgi:hypothetical protein